MGSKKTRLKYGKWYWDTRLDGPIFVLYSFTDRYAACLRPSIRFDETLELVLERVAKENIGKIAIDPAELDY